MSQSKALTLEERLQQRGIRVLAGGCRPVHRCCVCENAIQSTMNDTVVLDMDEDMGTSRLICPNCSVRIAKVVAADEGEYVPFAVRHKRDDNAKREGN